MCTRLGKKHFQYVGSAGLEQLKKDRCIRKPKQSLITTYRVRLLLEHTSLRDVYWNPQNNNPQGIEKRLSSRKAKHYAKLDKYTSRTN